MGYKYDGKRKEGAGAFEGRTMEAAMVFGTPHLTAVQEYVLWSELMSAYVHRHSDEKHRTIEVHVNAAMTDEEAMLIQYKEFVTGYARVPLEDVCASIIRRANKTLWHYFRAFERELRVQLSIENFPLLFCEGEMQDSLYYGYRRVTIEPPKRRTQLTLQNEVIVKDLDSQKVTLELKKLYSNADLTSQSCKGASSSPITVDSSDSSELLDHDESVQGLLETLEMESPKIDQPERPPSMILKRGGARRMSTSHSPAIDPLDPHDTQPVKNASVEDTSFMFSEDFELLMSPKPIRKPAVRRQTPSRSGTIVRPLFAGPRKRQS